MRGHRVVLLGIGSVALIVATSCTADDGLFGGGDGGSASGTGGSTSSTSGTGGSTSSTSTNGTGGDAGGTSSTSGTGGDGGAGGQGGADSSVDCNGSQCDPMEVCCYGQNSLSCTTPNACYGMVLSCDEPSDCTSPEVCCHQPGGDFFCAANCQTGVSQGMLVCLTHQDCSGGPAQYCCPTMPTLPKVCMQTPC
jgi:hypothetical protein